MKTPVLGPQMVVKSKGNPGYFKVQPDAFRGSVALVAMSIGIIRFSFAGRNPARSPPGMYFHPS